MLEKISAAFCAVSLVAGIAFWYSSIPSVEEVFRCNPPMEDGVAQEKPDGC